jgi:cell shape-determining protein MreC
MKTFFNISIPVILTISLVLLLNTGSASIYGQIIDQTNQTNQTGGQNTTEQAQQQLEQADQQMQQAQQQKEQAQQQLEQTNQTQSQNNQSKQLDPEMNEKLLNYTNAAILALNDDNNTAAQDNLVQIQNALINASGQQVVVVPAPAVSSDEEDSD